MPLRSSIPHRSPENLFGSEVQHIALATEDTFATVEHLKAHRVDLLPIPKNNYDDLEVRTDLSAEDERRLRAGNIVYDREGNAEYFQVYTWMMEGDFFFEFVERATVRATVR